VHHRSNRLVLFLVAALVAVMPLSSAFAQSAPLDEQCAAGYGVTYDAYGNPAYIETIMIYLSAEQQRLIDEVAGTCTRMIQRGWVTISKYGTWEARNGGAFYPVCRYDWDDGIAAVIYSVPAAFADNRDYCTRAWQGGRLRYF
jgi:hypothetical protein